MHINTISFEIILYLVLLLNVENSSLSMIGSNPTIITIAPKN